MLKQSEPQIYSVIDKYFRSNLALDFDCFWQLCQVQSHTSISPSNACTAKKKYVTEGTALRGSAISTSWEIHLFRRTPPPPSFSKLVQDPRTLKGSVLQAELQTPKQKKKKCPLSVTSHCSLANHVPKMPSRGQTTNNTAPH